MDAAGPEQADKVRELAESCSRQLSSFRNNQLSNDLPCVELLRLALVEHNQQAWEAIYNIYYPLVMRWVCVHPGFRITGEDADYFANQAFSRFWWYGARRARAGCFGKVADYLQYLKRCVGSAIEDELRWIRKDALGGIHRTGDFGESDDAEKAVPDETVLATNEHSTLESDMATNMLFKELWALLYQSLSNEVERIVAECTWQHDLAPRQIYRLYPDRFADESEVSQIRRNIVRRLSRRLMNDTGVKPLRQELENLS